MQLNTALFLALLVTPYTTAAPSTVNRSPSRLQQRAVCTPTSAGSASKDDVPAIQAAIASCGNGGTIVIPAGKTYQIRSMLSLAGCVGCDFQLEGTLKVSDDTDYWNNKQAIILLSGIKGAKFRSLTGGGLLDGNGQAAWERFAADNSYGRPTLHSITKSSSDILVSNLRVKNAPNVFFVATSGSTNIRYEHLYMTAVSSSSTAPKNTDGFDISSSYTNMYNISVSNQDDCVAFKPGANYVTVDTITCKGSHGLSVGSLGGGVGSSDSVTNIYVKNANMQTSSKAVGIKLYPGGSSHGTATVSNVTWDGVTVSSCDYAAQIQSCYNEDASYCTSSPSTAKLSKVYFKNFKGTTSSKYSPTTANMNCPKGGTCDIHFENWTVKPASGTGRVLCINTPSNIGVTCTSGASG
ncbi:glycoside hydrolase family 28 protein [Pseudovirgaria hyperparasitica]|uniref:Glycoside hydrolase family 28 protein n=1 Tax=Pseudovirgaria hyperparasitica TaxID=470096 RepID=A0A6A6WMN6_9PEZI|nr:glycoside hydrolase family 28 protein [Pseudovirgaria hyperparasitica]KAF2763413.1 glycoside hydrolase family 28 protein [Pseudovirgaria hyperparasitica]